MIQYAALLLCNASQIPALIPRSLQIHSEGPELISPSCPADELGHNYADSGVVASTVLGCLCTALAGGCNFCHSGIAGLMKEKKNKKTLFKDLHFTLGHKQYIHNQCSNLSPVSCRQKLCGKLIFKCNFSSLLI